MTTWLWLGLALLLVPAAGVAAPARADARGGRSPAGRTLSLRTLQLAALVAVCGTAVAAFGPTRGGAGAAVAAPLTWLAVARLHARPVRARADPAVPFVLDLAAAALRAGRPVSSALLLAAPAAGARCAGELTRAGRMLALGAEPAEAWEPLARDPVLGAVAAAARRSATSGIRLAAGFEQVAQELRAADRAVAEARAHRAGVFATAPLGLCFLPAFVCLAIVPVVVGIARGVLVSV